MHLNQNYPRQNITYRDTWVFFPDYQLDNGNMLRTTNDDAADEIFSTDYPLAPMD